jgi:hypothetical protein
MNEPAECYVPVIPGERWFYATYNAEQGYPAEFFYFSPCATGHNFLMKLSMSAAGEIEIERDHNCGRDCGCSTIYSCVPVTVMIEFMRQHGHSITKNAP